jgi:hypothetical protein
MDATTSGSTVTPNEKVPSQGGTGRRWLRTRLLTALTGACGFGMQLDRAAYHYRHPQPGASVEFDILVGLIFLALAMQNSIRLISQMRYLRGQTTGLR